MTEGLALIPDKGAGKIRSVDELVERVAQIAESLEMMDLRELVEVAEEAGAAARAVELRRYQAIHADAGRAKRALEELAVQAQRRAGLLLREIEGGEQSKGLGRGKGRTASPRAVAAAEAGIEKKAAHRMLQLAAMPEERVAKIREHLEETGKAVTVGAVLKAATKVSLSPDHQSDEWYTPEDIAEAVRQVFGRHPDEDPASCAVGQQVIKALRWWSASKPVYGEAEKAAKITKSIFGLMLERWGGCGVIFDHRTGDPIEPDESIQDPQKRAKRFAILANKYGRIGHGQQLKGKVFTNPPYGFPAPFVRAVIEGYIGRTLEQAATEYAAELGRSEEDLDADEKIGATWRYEAVGVAAERYGGTGPIVEAIVLVNVATGTEIQQYALAAAGGDCFFDGRIAFRDSHGEQRSGNRYEQVAYFFGRRDAAFTVEFSRFGQVTRRAA